ncbi:hypothetical protein GCM10010360_35520 [Streptomyces nogalater]
MCLGQVFVVDRPGKAAIAIDASPHPRAAADVTQPRAAWASVSVRVPPKAVWCSDGPTGTYGVREAVARGRPAARRPPAARRGAVSQRWSASTTAWAKTVGASCGRLWPMSAMVRCS